MKEKNLQPIYSFKLDGKVDTRQTFYFGSKATVRQTPGGNVILKVYNTDILKVMTTGRVEVTHWLPELLPFTLKAVNHFLRSYPNNLMEQANNKDLTTEELFKHKKKVKAKKVKPVKELIKSNQLDALPF